MKIIFIFAAIFTAMMLTGCSTVQKYWPRAHDPVLVDRWVTVEIAVTAVDCSAPTGAWAQVIPHSQHLYVLAEFRADPQTENLRGLWLHTQKMNTTANKTFCELGKKTAQARLAAARSAWAGR
jgi:hypothetical protein